ncbi:hypothetical protein [Streptomyces avicenniae]|uniref:hypothetical protein n=1 Tax=Streptomyces avicenniae TaxID=500153 RepID=UPI00069A35BE|nr:hypothetical protein [Streptomyces avicenniae]
MTIRWDKERVRAQAAEEIARSDPGERPLVTFHAFGASRPWKRLDWLGRALAKDCFVTLTERTVVVHDVGGFRFPGPRARRWTLPRDGSYLVEDSGRGTLFGHVTLRLPDGAGTLHCQVAHYWQPELDRFVDELTGVPVG